MGGGQEVRGPEEYGGPIFEAPVAPFALGFHRRGSWAEVIDVEDCLLASERNNAARNQVREWARREGIPAYDRRQQLGVLRNLVVREGRRTGQLQTRLVTARAGFAKPPVDLHTVVEGPGGGTEKSRRSGVR